MAIASWSEESKQFSREPDKDDVTQMNTKLGVDLARLLRNCHTISELLRTGNVAGSRRGEPEDRSCTPTQ